MRDLPGPFLAKGDREENFHQVRFLCPFIVPRFLPGLLSMTLRCKQYMSDIAFPVEQFYMDGPTLDRLPSPLPVSSLTPLLCNAFVCVPGCVEVS